MANDLALRQVLRELLDHVGAHAMDRRFHAADGRELGWGKSERLIQLLERGEKSLAALAPPDRAEGALPSSGARVSRRRSAARPGRRRASAVRLRSQEAPSPV